MPKTDTTTTTEDPLVIIEITDHRAVIGEFEYRAGHTMALPKSKADALVSLNKAKIIGVP